jgi:hypothetical protein
MAICNPLNIKTDNKQKLVRAAWVLGFLWLVSICASMPMAFFHEVKLEESLQILEEKRKEKIK